MGGFCEFSEDDFKMVGIDWDEFNLSVDGILSFEGKVYGVLFDVVMMFVYYN